MRRFLAQVFCSWPIRNPLPPSNAIPPSAYTRRVCASLVGTQVMSELLAFCTAAAMWGAVVAVFGAAAVVGALA